MSGKIRYDYIIVSAGLALFAAFIMRASNGTWMYVGSAMNFFTSGAWFARAWLVNDK